MPNVDQLLEEFIEQHLAGADPDPLEFMDRLKGGDREELAALIDAFYLDAPGRPWDPDAYRGSDAERTIKALERAIRGQAGLWPTLLPRLRHRLQIQREDLVARLAEKLGVAGKEEKVAEYYNGMEQGWLRATGVNGAVLEALGDIVGENAERLREAGSALPPGAGSAEASQLAFARTALPTPPEYEKQPGPAAERSAQQSLGELDEVDRLFTGG